MLYRIAFKIFLKNLKIRFKEYYSKLTIDITENKTKRELLKAIKQNN